LDAENKRLAREGLRDAAFGAAGDAAGTAAELDERAAALNGGNDLAGSREKMSMMAQIRAIKKQQRAGGLDSETASGRIAALRELYAARDRARDADLSLQVAQLGAEKELAEAGARATGQTGAQRESTLRIGRARADRILSLARLKAQVGREEANEQADDARDQLRELGGSRSNNIAGLLGAKGIGGSYDHSRYAGTMGFAMKGGNYGGGSFVGNDPRLRAEGIARAMGGRTTYNGYSSNGHTVGADGAWSKGHMAQIESQKRRADNSLVIQFAELVIDGADGGMRMARRGRR